MIPGRIADATLTLGAPDGWDPEKHGPCSGLPVRIDRRCGLPRFSSAWFPTPDEIAAIQAGAPVILRLVGNGHPPVMLSVGDKPIG